MRTISTLIIFLSLLMLDGYSSFGTAATGDLGTIKGKVINEITREPLPFVNVIVEATTNGATTDINGLFEIKNVAPGYVKIIASSVGYKTKISGDIFVTREKTPFIELAMEPTVADLKEVVISGPQFIRKEESPVSMQTIGIREIERNPGGNRDISKVIQSLPGVASTPSFRNDIIIRGGSPGENKFFIEGMEVPVINHFQTQGSSGGPVGMINVDLVREVDFYSSAFPANRGNALSSVMEFRLIDGNSERHSFRTTVGSSDFGITADGPIGRSTNYIVSLRRSYLQFLFQALMLPFLPTFNDLQFKVRHKIDKNNELIFLGISGFDEFRLNTGVNESVTDPEQLEYNNYILGNIPSNTQWNYATGVIYRHYGKQSYTNVVLSRNTLHNESKKYQNNDNINLLNNYESEETENKLRIEKNYSLNKLKVTFGAETELASHSVGGFDKITTTNGPVDRAFNAKTDLVKYAAFGSVSKPILKNRLMLSLGIRADGTNWSEQTSNPVDQLSPRFAASYSVDQKWSINFNTGRYFQLPSYSILGFSDENGKLINKSNKVTYISNDHLVSGVQFLPDDATKITVEGFYKKYRNYPFSLTDSISLANLGSDFGVVGNESVIPASEGRAYGLEVLLQRRSPTGIYGILAYTFVRSEFSGISETYVPSAWDNNHLITLTAGTKLGKDWELGFKWRYVGGRPYTPYDVASSSLKSNWDVRKQGILDYSRLNTLRFGAFHQLDVRADKVWYFTKWSLNLYLDIQNLYNFKAENQDILNVKSNADGTLVTDPNDNTRYSIYYIKDESGTILPSVGIIIDF